MSLREMMVERIRFAFTDVELGEEFDISLEEIDALDDADFLELYEEIFIEFGVNMVKGLMIDYDTADRITLCVLKDQLSYLLKEQRWFETPEADRLPLEEEYGHSLYVHPQDYVLNRDKHIPALRHLIEYFGG